MRVALFVGLLEFLYPAKGGWKESDCTGGFDLFGQKRSDRFHGIEVYDDKTHPPQHRKGDAFRLRGINSAMDLAGKVRDSLNSSNA